MDKSLKIIRPQQLCELLGISIPTLYRWHAEGHIPIQKIKFGKSAVGYRHSDVEDWLKESQSTKKGSAK